MAGGIQDFKLYVVIFFVPFPHLFRFRQRCGASPGASPDHPLADAYFEVERASLWRSSQVIGNDLNAQAISDAPLPMYLSPEIICA